jgi:Transposase DDE domain group 1
MAVLYASRDRKRKGTFRVKACQNLDAVRVTFDDDNAVANAGLVLTATTAQHLGLLAAAQESIRLSGPGAANAGAKAMTVIEAMIAGADCIDDVDVLRAGSTAKVLGHRVAAPSTIGTFLRGFTFGHVRQLDRFAEHALTAAWAAGAGPGEQPLVIDIDSTICEVHGYQKQGASFGYTRQRGLHPLLATRADTGEVLHVRFRKGSANTGRGAQQFVRETIGRVRRAGATGPITLRADSGFWSNKVVAACRDHGVTYSITVNRQKPIVAAIDAIPDGDWVDIAYTKSGDAQVAETPYNGHRLVVRRTRIKGDQPALFDEWRHHAFITDRPGTAIDADEHHRAHAVVELAIRDLKEGAGLNHCPSGHFHANAAWCVFATIAHNLMRWTITLGTRQQAPRVAKTMRRRLFAVAGRITTSGRTRTLHLPTRWPWAEQFTRILEQLRALPAPSG